MCEIYDLFKPTPVLYHLSRALSSAPGPCAAALSAVAWHDSCKALCVARAEWGPCSDVQLGVVVINVCGEGRKWPNEDD